MAVQIIEPYYYNGGYVDDIMTPFATFDDLKGMKSTKFFDGLKAVVNNNGLPVTFIFVGNIKQRFYWVISELPVFPTYGDLTATTSDIVTTFNTSSKYTRAFYVGLEATVQVGDETGGIEKYIVTEVNNGMPTWSLEVGGGGTDMSTPGNEVINMINGDNVGNVVYTTDNLYSYEKEVSGETVVVYTEDQSEAQGKPGYTEYPKALYVISADSSGNTVLSDVLINNTSDGTSIKVIGDDIE